jgi:hypothetical protein
MATDDNTEETSEIDDFEAAQEHLSKAMGIISAVHGAVISDEMLSERTIKDATWAAYDELEELRDAIKSLDERRMTRDGVSRQVAP